MEPRVRTETNVETVVQPKAAPHCFQGRRCGQDTGPHGWGAQNAVLWAVEAREGQSALPTKKCT